MRISKEFGQAIDERLGAMSGREGARRTGLSATVVNDMRNGRVVERTTIIRFASGLRVPEGPLLKAAGYVPEPTDIASAIRHEVGEIRRRADRLNQLVSQLDSGNARKRKEGEREEEPVLR